MYLDILHVFYTYLKRVQDTFRIHIRYIRIHVSYARPWCHSGYISGYIKIHVSLTLHHDTSRYTEIQNHDTCILDASWCWHGLIVSESQVLQVNELVEMHGSCPRPLHLLCAPLSLLQGRHTCKEERTWDTWRIHARYMRDTCGIHAGHMYLQRFDDT